VNVLQVVSWSQLGCHATPSDHANAHAEDANLKYKSPAFERIKWVLRPSLQLLNTSLAERKKKFETEFSDWIAAQNTWVEKQGIPGADLRPW
jgi:hypothetical protein